MHKKFNKVFIIIIAQIYIARGSIRKCSPACAYTSVHDATIFLSMFKLSTQSHNRSSEPLNLTQHFHRKQHCVSTKLQSPWNFTKRNAKLNVKLHSMLGMQDIQTNFRGKGIRSKRRRSRYILLYFSGSSIQNNPHTPKWRTFWKDVFFIWWQRVA